MSHPEEAYGPAQQETFTFDPAPEQTPLEYLNDILVSPLTTLNPEEAGTYYARWEHPGTGQTVELEIAKQYTAGETEHFTNSYRLNVRDRQTGSPLESFVYHETRRGKERKNTLRRESLSQPEAAHTLEGNIEAFRKYLQSAHIMGKPVAFRHGCQNDTVTDEFWHIIGYDFFSTPSIQRNATKLALTGDEDLREELLDEMCGPSHTLPRDFANYLLKRVVKLLQTE